MDRAVSLLLSNEEFFRYQCTDEFAKDRFYSILKEKEEIQEELSRNDRRIEIIEEQVYFAKELIDGIEAVLKEESRAKNITKRIKDLLENSNFEG